MFCSQFKLKSLIFFFLAIQISSLCAFAGGDEDHTPFSSCKVIGDHPIVISGAGIAGLALAYELGKLCIPYVILERDPKADFRNQGYGLTIIPGTQKYFSDSGIQSLLQSQNVVIRRGYQSYDYLGKALSLDLKDEKHLNQVVPRSFLRKVYLDQVGREKVLWGTQVSSFKVITSGRDQGKVQVVLKDEKENKVSFIASNLIAADGINSKIRKDLFKDEKQYLGVIGIYGLIPIQKAGVHLDHEFQVDDLKQGWRLFAKPFNQDLYNWQVFFPWKESDPIPSNHEILGYITSELEKMSWKKEYIDLVKGTDPNTMRTGLLYDRCPLEPLKNDIAVTLIGDAAHPLSPYKGRGANLALQGVRIFSELTAAELKLATQQNRNPNWVNINRTYENIHWPNAGLTQLGCRKSVMEHHFSGKNTEPPR